MSKATTDGSKGVKKALEAVTNGAVLVAAVLVTIYFVGQFFREDRPPSHNGPQAGLRLSPPEGYDFGAYERTLVLALRTDCSYCEADLPFYRELASIAEGGDCTGGIIAVFPNDGELVAEFQEKNELRAPAISNFALATFGVAGTPTAILVDSQGTVQDVWIGELQSEQEREILDAFAPQSTCNGPVKGLI